MTPFYSDDWLTIYGGDCRAVMAEMPAESVHCVVTSPPYWGLRDYGTDGQLGLEATPEAYVANMVEVFREVRRVLRDDGTVWLNLGDAYAGSWGAQSRGNHTGDDKSTLNGHPDGLRLSGRQIENHPQFDRLTGTRALSGSRKPKDLIGLPWMVAFALRADGWYLRSDIIWSKPNPMPESVTDRPTKAHEYLFLLSKSSRYYYDAAAVAEPVTPSTIDRLGQPTLADQVGSYRVPGKTNGPMKAVGPRFGGSKYGDSADETHRTKSGNVYDGASGKRNARTVWTVATQPYPGAHFATFPPKLVEPCVKAGCPTLGTVLDPFAGSGTALMVAQSLSRRAIGIDLNPDYLTQCLARNAAIPLGLESA